MAAKKSTTCPGFVIFFFIFYSAFTAVKRDSRLLTKYVKRVLFINGRYTKGISFLVYGIY